MIMIAATDPNAAALSDLSVGIAEILILAVIALSITFLASWFVLHRGPKALRSAPPRRNCVPLYLPLLLLMAWFGLQMAAALLIKGLLPRPTDAEEQFAACLAGAIIGVLMAAGTIIVAAFFFPRGLKGFGLDLRTIPRDLPAAFVNLVAVLPIVWLGVAVVDIVGKQLVGPDFQIKPNEALEALTENPDPSTRILMLTSVLLVVPLRRSSSAACSSPRSAATSTSWLAIFIASILFALMHPWQHWLGTCSLGGHGLRLRKKRLTLPPHFHAYSVQHRQRCHRTSHDLKRQASTVVVLIDASRIQPADDRTAPLWRHTIDPLPIRIVPPGRRPRSPRPPETWFLLNSA